MNKATDKQEVQNLRRVIQSYNLYISELEKIYGVSDIRNKIHVIHKPKPKPVVKGFNNELMEKLKLRKK